MPDVGETVPPLPGFVAVVNWYCVLNAAVYVVAVGGAVTVCEIAPPFDQLLKRYCVPAVPCGCLLYTSGSLVLRYNARAMRNLYAAVMVYDTGHPIDFHMDAFAQATCLLYTSRCV